MKLTDELFAKLDPFMKSHIQRALYERNSVHYLYKYRQNEILQILCDVIGDKILSFIQNDKYYSLILNCTPDAGKTEQIKCYNLFCFMFRRKS